MEKRTRTILTLVGLTLTLGTVAPEVARADDCRDVYYTCLAGAYGTQNRLIRQLKFIECAASFTSCLGSSC